MFCLTGVERWGCHGSGSPAHRANGSAGEKKLDARQEFVPGKKITINSFYFQFVF